MKLRTKDDIEFHSDGFRQSRPAVNVKVYDSLDKGFKKYVESGEDPDPRFTMEWIEEIVGDDLGSSIFWSMCEFRFEDLDEEARDIWGREMYTTREGARRYRINVYGEGRSGGWAIVDGINEDVDSWDAIEFGKWRRFAKFARATADGIMWDVVDSIYINHFIPWTEEQSELAAPNLPEGLRV